MANSEVSFARPDRLKTATFSITSSSAVIVSEGAKAGLVIKNASASLTVWIRDPVEGEPASGDGYPIGPGEELSLGDYRGNLKAISPSGTSAVYVAWTALARLE